MHSIDELPEIKYAQVMGWEVFIRYPSYTWAKQDSKEPYTGPHPTGKWVVSFRDPATGHIREYESTSIDDAIYGAYRKLKDVDTRRDSRRVTTKTE